MFKITVTNTGQTFGPFEQVKDTPEAFIADGTILPKHVIGPATAEAWDGDPYKPAADLIKLGELKDFYVKAANEARDRAEQAGFRYLNKDFDSDPVAVSRISIAALAAMAAKQLGQQFSVNWVAKDNSTVTLDADGMLGLMQALALNGMAIHAATQQAKADIRAAQTPEAAAVGLDKAPKAK